MTTAPPSPRPVAPMPQRAPGPQPAGPGGGQVALDPIRLLRQNYPFLLVALIFGAGLGVVTHFVWLYTYPIWKSEVTYECSPPPKAATDIGTAPVAKDEMERFMGTQVQIMKSDAVLQKAVNDREVQKTGWARQFMKNGRFQPDDAVVALTDDISAYVVTNTNLVRMTMTWTDPKDAATIASAVSSAYMDDIKTRGKLDSADKRAALSDNLRKISSDKQRANEQIDRLLKDNNVDDLDVAQGRAAIKVARLQDALVQTTEDLATYRSLLDGYEAQLRDGIIGDDLRQQVQQDPVILQFEQTIASLKAEKSALIASGYGTEHPQVTLMQRRIEAQQRERDLMFQSLLKKAFDAQVQTARTNISALEKKEKDLLDQLDSASRERQDLVRIAEQVQQLKDNVKQLNSSEAVTKAALDNLLTLDQLADSYRVRVLRAAQVPKEVTFPQLKILVPLGAVLLTGLTAGLIVLRELLDQRVRGPSDITMIPRLRLLGVIPRAEEDPSKPATVATAFRDTPHGVITESYRQLRAPLLRRMNQAGYKSLLVFGGMPGSGATTVSTNLALSCAAGQERVLIVDANLRRPSIHKIFGVQEGPGLADVLVGEAELDSVLQPTSDPNLSVLSAGSPSNRALPERLATDAMRRLREQAASRFDRIIVDAPPAIVSGDAQALANQVDATVVVVRAMQEKRGLVTRICSQLADSRSELMGVIVNAAPSSAGGYFKRNIRATHEYTGNGTL